MQLPATNKKSEGQELVLMGGFQKTPDLWISCEVKARSWKLGAGSWELEAVHDRNNRE